MEGLHLDNGQATAPADVPAERPTGRLRQRWEYQRVQCTTRPRERVYKVNGREAYPWGEGPYLDDYLAQLGNEGWELFAVPSYTDPHYWLKRPCEKS